MIFDEFYVKRCMELLTVLTESKLTPLEMQICTVLTEIKLTSRKLQIFYPLKKRGNYFFNQYIHIGVADILSWVGQLKPGLQIMSLFSPLGWVANSHACWVNN